jgi:hypothetical protein
LLFRLRRVIKNFWLLPSDHNSVVDSVPSGEYLAPIAEEAFILLAGGY